MPPNLAPHLKVCPNILCCNRVACAATGPRPPGDTVTKMVSEIDCLLEIISGASPSPPHYITFALDRDKCDDQGKPDVT